MSRRVKRNVDVNTSIPLDRLATPTQISSYIKRIVNASQYDFYETEALEVENVILNVEKQKVFVTNIYLLRDVKNCN